MRIKGRASGCIDGVQVTQNRLQVRTAFHKATHRQSQLSLPHPICNGPSKQLSCVQHSKLIQQHTMYFCEENFIIILTIVYSLYIVGYIVLYVLKTEILTESLGADLIHKCS